MHLLCVLYAFYKNFERFLEKAITYNVAPGQVDGFSARIKPEPKEVEEEEEEGIGDVDLFSLINEHTKLTINAKWLQHLQVRAHAKSSDSGNVF